MNKNNLNFTIPFLLIIVIAVIFNSDDDNIESYQYDTVKKRSFDLNIIEKGELEASRMIYIESPIISNQAKIIEMQNEGSIVKKGDIIAKFDTEPFTVELNRWQYKLNENKAKFVKAQKEVEIQKNKIKSDIERLNKTIEIERMNLEDEKLGTGLIKLKEYEQKIIKTNRDTNLLKLAYDDKKRLFDKGFISKQDIEKSKNEYLDQKEKLQNAQSNLENYKKYIWPKKIKENEIKFKQAEEKLQSNKIENQFVLESKKAEVKNLQETLKMNFNEFYKASKNIELCEVRAPIDGIILHSRIMKMDKKRKIDIGDTVWQNQAFMKIPDTKSMLVKTKIKEIDLRHIKKGLDVTIKLDAYPQKQFNGKISYIDPIAKTDNTNINIKYFDVTINVVNDNELLKSGMSVTVLIKYDRVNDVLAVPTSAILYDENGMYVLIKDGNEHDKQYIKIGKMSHTLVEIIDGLDENDDVVVR